MGQFAGAISNSAIGGAGVSGTESYRQAKEQLEKDFKQADLNRSPAQNEILYQQLLNEGNSPEEAAQVLRDRGVTVPVMPNRNVANTEAKKVDTGDPNREISVSSFLPAFVRSRIGEVVDETVEKAQKEIEKLASAVRKWWELDALQVRTTSPEAGSSSYRNRPELQVHRLRDLEGFGSINSQASLLGSYNGFVLTSVSVSDVEKVDIIETFGAPHIFASGTFVKKVTLSGFVRAYPVSDTGVDLALRVADYVKFRNFYEDYLRATRMAERGTIARLVVDRETYEGFFTNMSFNRDSQMEQVIPWSAAMLVTNHVHAADAAADEYLARKITQVEPEELAIDADAAYAEAADAEGTMNIFATKDIREASGEGKTIEISTGLLTAEDPHASSEAAQTQSALFAKGAGSGGVTVKVADNLKGIQLVALPTGEPNPEKGTDLRQTTFSGSEGTPPVPITYKVTNYYALLNSILDLGVEPEDKAVTHSVVFTVQSELPNDNLPVTVTVNLRMQTEAPYSVFGKLFVGPQFKARQLVSAGTSDGGKSQEFTSFLNSDKSNDIYDTDGTVKMRVELTLTEPGNKSKPLALSPDAFEPGGIAFELFRTAVSTKKEVIDTALSGDIDPSVDTRLLAPPTAAASGPKWQGGTTTPVNPEAVDVSRLEDGIISFDTSIKVGTKTKDGDDINWREKGSPLDFHRFWHWNMRFKITLRGLQDKTIAVNNAVNAESSNAKLYHQVLAIVPSGVIGDSALAGPGTSTSVKGFNSIDTWFNISFAGNKPRISIFLDIVTRDKALGVPEELKKEILKVKFGFDGNTAGALLSAESSYLTGKFRGSRPEYEGNTIEFISETKLAVRLTSKYGSIDPAKAREYVTDFLRTFVEFTAVPYGNMAPLPEVIPGKKLQL